MSLKIAIQPDEVIHANGERQSFSDRWMESAEAEDVSIVKVDVFAEDALSQIASCDAFMWRFKPTAFPRIYAQRLLFAIENSLGIPVFPNHRTSWHFEDKILQYYYLSLAGIPTPKSWICWTLREAEAFCRQASYPLVLKLASGFQSKNVRLIDNETDALYYARRLFAGGLLSFEKEPASFARLYYERLRAGGKIFIRGKYPTTPTGTDELHYGYFYAQEFLPDNNFDTRVTIIGTRAFAFRRLNRPGDFRASGSGHLDWDPKEIDESAVRLAYYVSRTMDAQTVAVDIIYKGREPVIVELTLAYASWAVRNCPGHWVLDGDPVSGILTWSDGSQAPEAAIFKDFIAEIRDHNSYRVDRRQDRLHARDLT